MSVPVIQQLKLVELSALLRVGLLCFKVLVSMSQYLTPYQYLTQYLTLCNDARFGGPNERLAHLAPDSTPLSVLLLEVPRCGNRIDAEWPA